MKGGMEGVNFGPLSSIQTNICEKEFIPKGWLAGWSDPIPNAKECGSLILSFSFIALHLKMVVK